MLLGKFHVFGTLHALDEDGQAGGERLHPFDVAPREIGCTPEEVSVLYKLQSEVDVLTIQQ